MTLSALLLGLALQAVPISDGSPADSAGEAASGADALPELSLSDGAEAFVSAGFLNVRSLETAEYKVYTIENDYYSVPVDGVRAARALVQDWAFESGKKVKIIMTTLGLPELTMSYDPASGLWASSRRFDSSWKAVRSQAKAASSFGKANISFYPQLSLKNLIINQVYQTLWQICPTLEVGLWPGSKLSYQLKLPLYNDGYNAPESLIHPGVVSFSQSFRLGFLPGFQGKFTLGSFSAERYGAALDACYFFPGDRFGLEAQLSALGIARWTGFKFQYEKKFEPRWKVFAHYFEPVLQTQFRLGVQKFLMADVGLMYEMTRHFHHAAVSLYAVKAKDLQLNVGFRIAFTLPPYKQSRHGYFPKFTTATPFALSYNANNELYGYREFRCEPSESILQRSDYNPHFIEYQLR